MSKDYERLIELLDRGERVLVEIQLHPEPCEKTPFLAFSSVIDGRKYYTVGYGLVFDKKVLIRQCKTLKLKFNDNADTTREQSPLPEKLERD